jgi:hypothetical protein
MRNPIRRSRAIGTARQGRTRANKLTIAAACQGDKAFYEQLGHYEKVALTINGHPFVFVLEQTQRYSAHACSVAEVASIIEQLPVADYGELRFIVFRQPKRKEELLAPVWGRLIYSYSFEGQYFPAIVLEAVDYRRKLKWPISLPIEMQRELARLQADGHLVNRDKHFFTVELQLENVRATQLYRTLPHEFGHYVQYLTVVEQAAGGDSLKTWEARRKAYAKIPHQEKEVFAHRYADRLRQKLVNADQLRGPK